MKDLSENASQSELGPKSTMKTLFGKSENKVRMEPDN